MRSRDVAGVVDPARADDASPRAGVSAPGYNVPAE